MRIRTKSEERVDFIIKELLLRTLVMIVNKLLGIVNFLVD